MFCTVRRDKYDCILYPEWYTAAKNESVVGGICSSKHTSIASVDSLALLRIGGSHEADEHPWFDSVGVVVLVLDWTTKVVSRSLEVVSRSLIPASAVRPALSFRFAREYSRRGIKVEVP